MPRSPLSTVEQITDDPCVDAAELAAAALLARFTAVPPLGVHEARPSYIDAHRHIGA